jgi:hypothetical protein
MPTLNTETQKARRVESQPQANPVDLLKKVVEANPKADTDAIYEEFKEKLLQIDNDAYLDIVIMSWFGPAYSRLTAPEPDPKAQAEQRDRRKAEERALVEAKKAAGQARMAKIVLLDMVLPHGKSLKDSTGRECAQLGPQIGDWLNRVAGEVRPTQVVGKVLSEERLQELYAA